LIEGEELSSANPRVIRHWVVIYSELVSCQEHLAETLADGGVEQLRPHLDRSRKRLNFWRSRLLEVEGLDVDPRRMTLRHGESSVRLTGRELQLLRFLLDHPNQRCTSDALLREAWRKPWLAREEVRTYISRVRAKLAAVGAPCEIRTEIGQGYALVWR
jgi:DNA-binding response OmpR family regulator